MEKSRTEYSAKNTAVAIMARVSAILMGFFARVVFTHTLSQAYVGINGLFTDILNVLALSELGVGTAVTFALYKPIAEKDFEKQKSLMRLYKHFYIMIAGIIFAAGLLVIPFMDILIKDRPEVDHLILIYLMYLINSVLSYVGVYKRTLIDAHQLSYISVVYQTMSWVVQNILQIVILLTTHNFLLYLSMLLVCTLGNNILISRKADSMYPYLREKNVTPLSKEEKSGIYSNIRAMLMHKIGNVLVNNTDNLLLSALVGTLSVGRYSNYYLVIGSFRQLLEQVFRGITASVGNLGVQENEKRIKTIFEATFFLNQWICGMVAIALFEVLDVFVGKSFGTQYVFPSMITLVLCLNFYLTGMRQSTLVFRDSMGLFRYDRYKAFFEASINLVVSIWLGRIYGTIGVFLGTMISTITTSLWVEPYMLYKHKLHSSSKVFFVKYALYASVTGIIWYLQHLICSQITGNPWVVIIARGFICVVLTNCIYWLLYHRTKEYKLLYEKAVRIILSKLGIVAHAPSEISEEDRLLLKLLEKTLHEDNTFDWEAAGEIDFDKLLRSADSHSVTPILFPILEEAPLPAAAMQKLYKKTQSTVLQNYRLLFLSKYIVETLERENIATLLLKGAAIGSFFPVPEARKTGDVDILLLDVAELKKACGLLQNAGLKMKDEQVALHHIVFEAENGIEIELHTLLAEPFDNNTINEYLEKKHTSCIDNMQRKNMLGVSLPMLKDGYHAYELLLHMLQHFLRSGFGLKLLCDWAVFWNRQVEDVEKEKYLQLVRESGIKGFSDMVTEVCCNYLGLKREYVEWMQMGECDTEGFLAEIFEAGEFGKSSEDRMVALRSNSLIDYWREFHHQMRLNYPNAGKIFICWPVLWVMTFIRFLQNNKKVRKTSGWAILQKAGQRGHIIKQMKLFNFDKK